MKQKLLQIILFLVCFYFLFFTLSLCGYFLIDYRCLSIVTIMLFSLFVISLVLGSYVGSYIPVVKIKPIKSLDIDIILLSILIISLVSTIIGFYYIISHYGTLGFVLSHGTAIREETIGDGLQLKPTIISYLSSLTTIGIPIALGAYCFSHKKKYIWYVVMFFVVVVLGDLQTFGRIGILFAIFLIVSYTILCVRNISYLRCVFCTIILVTILMLPKFIRAGNTLEGMGSRYEPYMIWNLPNCFEPIITIYAYYFSGIFALDYLLEQNIEYSYGTRNLSALYNLLNRIFESQDGRNSIIADVAYVPFDTNIYTIVGELYLDWGVLGVFLGALIYGVVIGSIFRYKGVFALSLKIVLIAWILETPIYNIFSFGGYFMMFVILIIFTLLFDAKGFNYYRKL